MGAVTELVKGTDDDIRGAIVRNGKGSYIRRPICKLYALEQFENNSCLAQQRVTRSTLKKISRLPCQILGGV